MQAMWYQNVGRAALRSEQTRRRFVLTMPETNLNSAHFLSTVTTQKVKDYDTGVRYYTISIEQAI